MQKLLIVGDSFATDYSLYQDIEFAGWPNLLAEKFDTVNLAQAGVSQYKILKQIQSVDLQKFDKIIVSVTSPNRVFCKQHPIHKSGLHYACDLIYNDINRISWFNIKLTTAKNWFKYYFDKEYAEDIHSLITDKIRTLLQKKDHILIAHHDSAYLESDIINFNKIWEKHKGSVNHYTKVGNQKIFESIYKIL